MSVDVTGGGWEGGGENDAINRDLLEYLQDKGRNGVVIDGLVTWIELEQETVAEVIYMAHAVASFTDEESNEAKAALWKACEKNIGETAPPRQGLMVHKAPVAKGIPLDANAGDIINRVTMLENSLTTFIKQQNEQMTNLTNSIGAIGPAPPSALNTKAFKHVKVVNLDSPGKRKRLEENEEAVEVEKDDASKHPSYASVAQLKKVGTGNVPGIRRMEQTDNRQRTPSIMYGTFKVGTDDTQELLAADVSLVASGVSKDATAEQLKEFIEGKGIGVIEIEKLTKEDAETRTNTFKVVVKLSDYEKAMQPEVWPYRLGVWHYKPQRRNQQGMSWQQQSQQAGGQLQQRQPPPARGAGVRVLHVHGRKKNHHSLWI